MLSRLSEVIGVLLFIVTIFSPLFIGEPWSIALFLLSIILINHKKMLLYINKSKEERLQWFGKLLQEVAALGSAFILGTLATGWSWKAAIVAATTTYMPLLILLLGLCAALGSYLARSRSKMAVSASRS